MQIRKLLKSSVYVTPEFEDISTKRYKLKVINLAMIVAAYSFGLIFFLLGVLYVLPSDKLIFLFRDSMLEEQAAKLEQFDVNKWPK